MSWHGPQQRGAMAARRAEKRRQAEARQAVGPARLPGDCSRKARFFTQAAADQVLLTCKIARALRHNTKRRELRTYWCRTHDCWHLTSKPERPREAA